MSRPFLRNSWYVAAWADELTPGQPITRRLLDDPVVLWRDAQGQAHALLNRCPHRFALLSDGRVMEDGTLQCPYHGLQFDGAGHCTLNPHGNGAIPKAAQVRSFPVVERHTAVWIWMGDPARADASRIVDFSLFERTPEEGSCTIHGHFTVQAGYELEIDNLMDLSHPEFVHATSLGSSAHHSAQYEAGQEGDTRVYSNRWFSEGPCPPALDAIFQSGGRPVEHWANMRWDAPSLLLLEVGVTLTGRPRSEGMNDFAAHLLTPESATSTHYFYTHTRTHDVASREMDEIIRGAVLHAFLQEDRPLLEKIQQQMGDHDLWSMKPVMLGGDAGGVRARRLLEQLIAAEQREV